MDFFKGLQKNGTVETIIEESVVKNTNINTYIGFWEIILEGQAVIRAYGKNCFTTKEEAIEALRELGGILIEERPAPIFKVGDVIWMTSQQAGHMYSGKIERVEWRDSHKK